MVLKNFAGVSEAYVASIFRFEFYRFVGYNNVRFRGYGCLVSVSRNSGPRELLRNTNFIQLTSVTAS